MQEVYKKYGPTLIVLFLLYLSYILFKPFLMAIVSAAIIAYLFYPVFKFILKFTKRDALTSIIMILIIFLILFFPSFYILQTLIKEIPSLYNSLVIAAEHASLVNEFLNDLSVNYGITIELANLLGTVAFKIINFLQNLLLLIPERILNISISAFFLFFFFKDGDKIIKQLTKIMPFGIKKTKKIFSEVKLLTDAVVYGQLITAIIQFFLCFASYSFLGIKGPLFWAIVTFFFSLIPMVGPAIIYVPLSILLVINGILQASNILIFKGIFLLAFGLGIISSVDNIIKPLVISDKVKIHPGVIVIGVIGGITTFGIMGLVLGPLILVLLITIFSTYKIPSFDK